MTSPTTSRPHRIVYREILPGDRLKLNAESALATTGGGARDFRFNHAAFGPLFALLLPGQAQEERRRGNAPVMVTVQRGDVRYSDPPPWGPERTAAMTYEPPTDARPSEGRIPRVHELPFLADPPQTIERTFVLFVQDTGGDVRAHYVVESSLRSGLWDGRVAGPILTAINETPDRQAVMGFIDLEAGRTYHHV